MFDDDTMKKDGTTTSSARGETPLSQQIMYVKNLVQTVQAEVDAIPGPLDEVDSRMLAGIMNFLAVADLMHPAMAVRLIQAVRVIVRALGTVEAPTGDEPPSAVPG